MFIDVHCHLESLDLEKVIKNARAKKVGIIITQGTNKETNRKAIEFSSKYPEVKAALGMYPSEGIKLTAKEIEEEIKFIIKNKDKVQAIGEVGLDLKELNTLDKQKEVFEKFIDLSIKLDKPIIIHSRKAELETIEILEKKKAKKVIMHCFSGKISLVERIAKNGWFLSIPANITFSEHFQIVAKKIPLSNLLCETDSPYLHPAKEFPNEPANVIESYKKIAEIKELTTAQVEKAILDNYNELFN